jgi:hypothetical protein
LVMRRQLILGVALLCGAASQAPAYDLSQHEWRHRLLFLIAPQSEDAGLKMQQREIALRRNADAAQRNARKERGGHTCYAALNAEGFALCVSAASSKRSRSG